MTKGMNDFCFFIKLEIMIAKIHLILFFHILKYLFVTS